jgi:GNAT superfamily N-acetyltransferase
VIEIRARHGNEPVLEVGLNDGRGVSIRPLLAGESQPLVEIFEGMSVRSRYLRYLAAINRLSPSMLAAMTGVDHERHSAFLAYVDARPVGVARFIRLDRPGPVAEFAVEVVDRQQGRGIARILLDAAAIVANHHGIRFLAATLAPDNVPSRKLLAGIGARFRFVDGLLLADAPMPRLPRTTLDRSAVIKLADRALAGTV